MDPRTTSPASSPLRSLGGRLRANGRAILALGALSMTAACGGGGGDGGGGAGNAELSSLTLSVGSLSPAFQPTQLTYTSPQSFPTTSVQLTVTAQDAAATITVAGQGVFQGQPSPAIVLAVGSNPIAVQVTASDGVTVLTYTVDAVRQAAVAYAQEAYLKASNTGGSDYFGCAVAVSGDTVVVGAFVEDSASVGVNGQQASESSLDSGAVYVFVRDGLGQWSQQAYLKASNTGSIDGFGYSVAISGDTIAVGARGDDSDATGVNGFQGNANGTGGESGAVYVFVRGGTLWSQQAYVKPSNTRPVQSFGHSVALSGDTLVVGAVRENSAATGVNGNQADQTAADAGAAYVFVRNGSTWSQQAYLKASNTSSDDQFGSQVAVSGDTVAVGAPDEGSASTGVNGSQTQGNNRSGAVYVFVRNVTTWTQQAYLKASNSGGDDLFGAALSLDGNTLAVGAWGEASAGTGVNANQADNTSDMAGAAYVFVRNGVTWTQQAYLKASNTSQAAYFGFSVAVADDRVAVGAPNEDSAATGVNGNQAGNGAPGSGAVYVFQRDGGGQWSQQAYVKASNTDTGDGFGVVVALSTNTVVAGATSEASAAVGVNGNQTDDSLPIAGAAYVLR